MAKPVRQGIQNKRLRIQKEIAELKAAIDRQLDGKKFIETPR
jgi:hypothetical protein